MYNQTYINDFDEKKYLFFLQNPSSLEEVKTNYLYHYSAKTPSLDKISIIKQKKQELLKKYRELRANGDIGTPEAKTLENEVNKLNSDERKIVETEQLDDAAPVVFKESLDHYILKRITEDSSFIKTQEFKNYLVYIFDIYKKRKFDTGNTTLYLELNTNVVFRSKEIRDLIFKEYLSSNDIKANNALIAYNEKILNNIVEKLKNRKKVTQKELDFLSDYLYTSRNFENEYAQVLAEYVLNEITPESNIKASIHIIGALLSYFTQCYNKDESIKNSRMFIGTLDGGKIVDVAHSSGRGKYCVFDTSLCINTSLTSKKSLEKSRTFKENDIYFLMMVSFHELTHEYQKNKIYEKTCTSSGLGAVIKDILNRQLSKKDKNNNVLESEYSKNHDSSEYEIEADEESWKQCETFIAKHVRQYCYRHGINNGIQDEIQCKKNAKEVGLRRAFSLKETPNGNLETYDAYDIRYLINILRRNPEYVTQYPMLQMYFNEKGQLKPEVFFTNITDQTSTGLDVNNSSLEFATYAINNGSETLINIIKSGKLNSEQLMNFDINMYNVIHQNLLKLRTLRKVNLDNYDETNHKFDLKGEVYKIYEHHIKACADQLYTSLRVIYQIRINYPSIDINEYLKRFYKYHVNSLLDILFSNQINAVSEVREDVIIDICKKYEQTKTPELTEIANYIRLKLEERKTLYSQPDDTQPGMKAK